MQKRWSMKSEFVVVVMCMLMHILLVEAAQGGDALGQNGKNQHEVSVRVEDFYLGQDRMQDLSWAEWFGKICENFMISIKIGICVLRLHLFSDHIYDQISLLQEKRAENLAELGDLQKALWYSQESLRNSAYYLAEYENKIVAMQLCDTISMQAIQNVRDQIMQYTQHVQTHIITMTDFAEDEKKSASWQTYERMLMRYFEKMQQVMQSIDACDELLCKHDSGYCIPESSFDADQYD